MKNRNRIGLHVPSFPSFNFGPLLVACLLTIPAVAQEKFQEKFRWPDGNQAAISLSFDDGRVSQIDTGLDLLAKHKTRVTFYVTPSSVENRLEGWKRAVREGHEIGNHSRLHPCSGNFPWSRHKALEDYTLEQMRTELSDANRMIAELLNVTPTTFAYPCGQTFVGRGRETKSYVPVAAELFLSSRGWLDEAPNDPAYCDFAQLTGMELDGKTFDDILPLLESTREAGHWLVFAGHEIGTGGAQTTRVATLNHLLAYVHDPANKFWIAPVQTIARYVRQHREKISRND